MKSHTDYLTFNTKNRREFINITSNCEEALRKSGVKEGMMLVSAMHITAGVWVNDNSAKIAKKAHKEHLTLREATLALGLLSDEDFTKIVDPTKMTGPK
jgi:thiamine phosphate synthase YjbQ (UPF0047 family)